MYKNKPKRPYLNSSLIKITKHFLGSERFEAIGNTVKIRRRIR